MDGQVSQSLFFPLDADPSSSKEHYDRGVNTFSPEGRIYQIEYAIEAIKVRFTSPLPFFKTWLKFGSTAIGIRTNEGVVLGVEKKLPSKLMEPSKSEKLVEVSAVETNTCRSTGTAGAQ